MSFIRGKRFFVWDFDGSFCNTERLHYLAYKVAFAEFGYALPEEGYYHDFTHLGEGTRKVIQAQGLNVAAEVVMERKKKHYWRIVQEVPPEDFIFPGSFEIFKNLSKKGPLAIASNSPQEEIELILDRAGLRLFLKLIAGREEKMAKKPAPDIFLAAFERLGATPEETMVFEDSERGLEAAARAGAHAALLRTPFNHELRFTQPYVWAGTHTMMRDELCHVDG
jgi:beta-phosphoglucomutase